MFMFLDFNVASRLTAFEMRLLDKQNIIIVKLVTDFCKTPP